MATLDELRDYCEEVEQSLYFHENDGIKTCTKCFETKSVKFFRSNKRTIDGYESQCKACKRINAKPPTSIRNGRLKELERFT